MIAAPLTVDPAWPWSLPGLGLPAFGVLAAVLTLLTLWTYLGVRHATWRRVLVVLGLRVVALVIALVLVLRPSLARPEDDSALPSRLLFAFDYSESMKFTDTFQDLSRWQYLMRILQSDRVQSSLRRLADQRIEAVYYQGAHDLTKFDPATKPEGKRTDIGLWLQTLLEKHAKDPLLRGVLLFSDGADNGPQAPTTTLEKAAQWRRLAAIHTFGVGSPTTTSRQRDIAWDQQKILVDPSPVGMKAKMTVKAYLNAPGFENAGVNVHMFLDEAGKPASGKQTIPAQRVVLKKAQGNEVVFSTDAPAAVGEYRVTLKADVLPGEVSAMNNEVSTYVTVTKEGLSVLWVDRKRAFEPVFAIRYGLAPDKRFRVYQAEPPPLEKGAPGGSDWYGFDKQHYDVIVIGDVSASRFAGGDMNLLRKINELVRSKGVGLVMLGGYETFGNDDWPTTGKELADLFPVKMDQRGQIDEPARMLPTEAGRKYLLRIHDDEKKSLDVWNRVFDPLEGTTRLGKPSETAIVFATREGKEPILVGANVGNGRTLAFAADTTWQSWRRSPEALEPYARFWRQMMLWAAKREEQDTSAWIALDKRRLPSGDRAGFTVGLRDKTGNAVPNAKFSVKVIGPNKEEVDVPTSPESERERGYFWKTVSAGEYEIVLNAVDPSDKSGKAETARARFLVYAEDLENLRPAADYDLLTKIAQTGGGKFHVADETKLVQFLDSLQASEAPTSKPRLIHWPDWRRTPPSDAAGDQLATLWNSAALLCFLLFVSCLCTEWFLRRKWGMV